MSVSKQGVAIHPQSRVPQSLCYCVLFTIRDLRSKFQPKFFIRSCSLYPHVKTFQWIRKCWQVLPDRSCPLPSLCMRVLEKYSLVHKTDCVLITCSAGLTSFFQSQLRVTGRTRVMLEMVSGVQDTLPLWRIMLPLWSTTRLWLMWPTCMQKMCLSVCEC